MKEIDLKDLVEATLRRAAAASSGTEIVAECLRLANFLLEKNQRYGDSALNPLRVHSSAHVIEQLRVRMDDKLSRMIRGQHAGEDPALDYVGYWVLLQIAEARDAVEYARELLEAKTAAAPAEDESQESFDRYLERKLQDPAFAEKYKAARQSMQAAVIPPPPPAAPPSDGVVWESKFGPICQNEGCDNHTGNSERVICPPCMRKQGIGSALRLNGNGKEETSWSSKC